MGLLPIACASLPTGPSTDRVVVSPQVLAAPDSPDREMFVRNGSAGKPGTFLLLSTTSKDINQLYLKGYKFYKLRDVSDATVRPLLGQVMRLSVSPPSVEESSAEEWVAGTDTPQKLHSSNADLAPLGSPGRAQHRCVVNPLAYHTHGEWPLRAYGPRNGVVCIESVDGSMERGLDLLSGRIAAGGIKPSSRFYREYFDARTGDRLGPVFEEDKQDITCHTAGDFWSADGSTFLALHGNRLFVYDLTRCIPKPDPSKPAAAPAPDQVRSLFEAGPRPKPSAPSESTPGEPKTGNPSNKPAN